MEPPRSRRPVGEILRSRQEAAGERRGPDPDIALIIGAVLTIGAIATTFVVFPVAALLLVLAPGAVSFGWSAGGSPRRATVVTAVLALLLGLAVGALGFLANPCVADPPIVGLVGGTASAGVFVLATAVGRAAGGGGRIVTQVVASGVTALVGFGATLSMVISNVFVLC